MIKNAIFIGVASLYFLSGCASSPKEIQPSFVSPLQYKDYNCDQIVEEMSYVNRETVKLYTHLAEKAKKDKWIAGSSVFLYGIPLLFLEGDNNYQATEYAQLKGEYRALQKAAIRKQCSKDSFPPSPEEVLKQKQKETEDAESKKEDDILG